MRRGRGTHLWPPGPVLAPCCLLPLLVACGTVDEPRAEAPQWPVTRVATIQPGAMTDGMPFGRIADLEIGDDGSVFVLDGLNRTIRVFDQEGGEVRAFGRRGRGPGELEQPAELLWGPGGNLWVLDIGNGRLTAFSPAGDLLATYTPSDMPTFFPLAVGFAGQDILRWVGVTSPDPARPAAAWVETKVENEQVMPIRQSDLPFVEWPLLFKHSTSEISLVLPVPFSGEPLFAFGPAGQLWYAYSAEPQVHRWATSGDFDLTVGRDLRPTMVGAADREEALARAELDEVRSNLGQAGIAEISGLIPEARPFYAGLFLDDAGALWVMHANGDASAERGRTIDVYDTAGTWIATVRSTVAASPTPRVRNGLLAGVARDELGVESVVVESIDRGPGR